MYPTAMPGNFLLPKKLAVPANADNMNKMIMQDKAKKAQMEAEKARRPRATAEKLKELMVKIPAKAGSRRPPLRHRHQQGDLRGPPGPVWPEHRQEQDRPGRAPLRALGPTSSSASWGMRSRAP